MYTHLIVILASTSPLFINLNKNSIINNNNNNCPKQTPLLNTTQPTNNQTTHTHNIATYYKKKPQDAPTKKAMNLRTRGKNQQPPHCCRIAVNTGSQSRFFFFCGPFVNRPLTWNKQKKKKKSVKQYDYWAVKQQQVAFSNKYFFRCVEVLATLSCNNTSALLVENIETGLKRMYILF